MENRSCYGEYGRHGDECGKCELKKWCVESSEIQEYVSGSSEELNDNIENKKSHAPEARYTREQLIHLSRMLMTIKDNKAQELVLAKLERPSITLSELAAVYGCTKQNIGKTIKRICREYPVLNGVLCNKVGYNRWRICNNTHVAKHNTEK